MLTEIERVVQADIRPKLALHGGDIRLLDFQDGVLRFELLGQCSGCPSASITTEELIRSVLAEAVPQVKDVVLVERVNEDLVAQAKAILNCHRL